MIFAKSKTAKAGGRARGVGYSALDFDDDWRPPEKPPIDWKKVLLLLGLGTLSWISTYTGMLELIEANMGDISLVMKVAIGFAVAMLMLMIIWLLDQLFDRLSFSVRVLYITGYLFLTLISVGFGFGFYWKFLESRSEASRSASSAVTQVQTALEGAQARLEQLQTTLATLAAISQKKAIAEREKGNSCPNSRPGDGPRRRLRDADAARFSFASKFVEGRVATVKQDIALLNKDLAKIVNRDKSTVSAKDGTRNAFLRALNRKLDVSVARFNAFRTDPQLMQIRSELAERAGKTIFDNGKGGTFSCPDPELQSALRGVVRAIDQLPELERPKIAAVEGSEAIIEAFRRLTTTLYGVLKLKLPPSPDELRAAQQRAVQSIQNVAVQRRILAQQPGLGERDYIPLFIALFVDFCLLLVSVSRPMNGFHWLDHKMGEAQEWPVIKILSRFRDIHKDEEIREVFEVFRHVVFDWRGVYYAAIPLNGTDPTYRGGLADDAALQAQLLANLFTSFENDKVYTRVPLSFFTTGFIQRKLREQGSKFADAEAFRIYRFRKAMWQDWMLSAMMGAAKRIEAQKRRQRTEAELFGPIEPHFAEPANENDTAQAPAAADGEGGDGGAEGTAGGSSEAPRGGTTQAADNTAADDTIKAESTTTAGDGNSQARGSSDVDEMLARVVEEAVRETLETVELVRRNNKRTATAEAAARPAFASHAAGANGTAASSSVKSSLKDRLEATRAAAAAPEPMTTAPEGDGGALAGTDLAATDGAQANGNGGNGANGSGLNAEAEVIHLPALSGFDEAAYQAFEEAESDFRVQARVNAEIKSAVNESKDESESEIENVSSASHAPEARETLEALEEEKDGRQAIPTAEAEPTFRRQVRNGLPAHMAPLATALATNGNGNGNGSGNGNSNGIGYGVTEVVPDRLAATSHASTGSALMQRDRIEVVPEARTEVIPRRPGDDLEMAQLAREEHAAWQEAGPEWHAEHHEALGPTEPGKAEAEGPAQPQPTAVSELVHEDEDEREDEVEDEVFDWEQPNIEIGNISQWFRKGNA